MAERKMIFCILVMILTTGCTERESDVQIDNLKNEIVSMEKDFAKMAKDVGVVEAFLEFMADDGVMIRGDQIISGMDAAREYFKAPFWESVIELDWSPDFADVSKSGDIGYTFGRYILRYKNSKGEIVEDKGVYRTIWKRQDDGSWKFVLD